MSALIDLLKSMDLSKLEKRLAVSFPRGHGKDTLWQQYIASQYAAVTPGLTDTNAGRFYVDCAAEPWPKTYLRKRVHESIEDLWTQQGSLVYRVMLNALKTEPKDQGLIQKPIVYALFPLASQKS